MPLSAQLARGLAPAGRRLLGMGIGMTHGCLQHPRRYLAATAAAAAVRFS
jgi:hypothetical protein